MIDLDETMMTVLATDKGDLTSMMVGGAPGGRVQSTSAEIGGEMNRLRDQDYNYSQGPSL